MAHDAFPDFFADAPAIETLDPLAALLGASEGGRLQYRYVDAVRMAGHSCPTVASAFLMTRAALRRLYGDELPRRGEIRVQFRDQGDAGVTGVVAAVATLITGATEDSGFPGLAGQFRRRERLFFGSPTRFGEIAFSRLDGGATAEVAAHLQRVAGDPRTSALMRRCLQGEAAPHEAALLRELWQSRVRRLLIEHADDPDVIEVRSTSSGVRP